MKRRLSILTLIVLLILAAAGAGRAELTFSGYNRAAKRLPPPQFSPDGTLLAVANYYDVQLRRHPSYELVQTLPMPNGRVGSLAFAPDGTLLVGDVNGALAFFKPGQTTPARVEALNSPVNALAVSPDGRHIALSGDMRTGSRIVVLDSRTLQQRFELPKSNAWHLQFLDNDRLLAVEEWVNDFVKLISLSGQKVLHKRTVTTTVHGVAHNRRDNLLYLGSSPRLILLDAGTLRETARFQDNVRPNPIAAVAWHEGTGLLVTAEAEGPLTVRDPDTGAIRHRLYGHVNRPEQATISPDGSRIISLTGYGELAVWDRSDFKPLIRGTRTPPPPDWKPAPLQTGRQPDMKLSWKRNSTVATVRLPGEKKGRTFTEGVDGIETWAGDQRQFCIAGSRERTKNKRTDLIELRDSATLEPLMVREYRHEHRDAHGAKQVAMLCRDRSTVLLLSTTSLTVFRNGGAETVVIPQRGTGNNQFTAMALSPDGRYLVLGERLGVIRLIRTADYRLVQQLFTDHSLPAIRSVAVSDRGIVEAILEDGSSYRWDAGQGGTNGT